MSESVKTNRRTAQARATRLRIIDSARTLFLDHGYAATTLERIAEGAGVAVQTVYFHFGNKSTVLKEVMDVLSVGDDAPVPLLEWPWVRQVREEPDARRALAIWVRNSRLVFGRVAPLLSVVRDAAGADPDMAAQWRVNQDQRYLAHRTFAEILAAKNGLRRGLTVSKAADVIFTLLSPEVYLLATRERGWGPVRWQTWLTELLANDLLGPDPR
ncbi:TetR family transcriptional regulator [Amycolatopsis sulphurea]|uniref:TetR family transcriptional regulator n=1 Tax=Amycolatopsis sulphurea TaxID=76022 RepID=A0A2A9F6S9_9PSEU|nr:TetR/AcrR family transcriptional regulator [Amycolatopsis sulphurea]PFG47044.1 TetR family transcriptional regulator [Amycolatopsis sulphurea]